MTRELRPAVSGDLDELCALDQRSFDNPWTREHWANELRLPQARVDVVVDDGRIVGLACTWTVDDAVELLRIATAPEARRQGVGGDLLRAVLERARAAACTGVTLEVGRRNRTAVDFYRNAGFAVVGVRKGYYRRPPDDALLMAHDLRGVGEGAPAPVDSGGPLA